MDTCLATNYTEDGLLLVAGGHGHGITVVDTQAGQGFATNNHNTVTSIITDKGTVYCVFPTSHERTVARSKMPHHYCKWKAAECEALFTLECSNTITNHLTLLTQNRLAVTGDKSLITYDIKTGTLAHYSLHFQPHNIVSLRSDEKLVLTSETQLFCYETPTTAEEELKVLWTFDCEIEIGGVCRMRCDHLLVPFKLKDMLYIMSTTTGKAWFLQL